MIEQVVDNLATRLVGPTKSLLFNLSIFVGPAPQLARADTRAGTDRWFVPLSGCHRCALVGRTLLGVGLAAPCHRETASVSRISRDLWRDLDGDRFGCRSGTTVAHAMRGGRVCGSGGCWPTGLFVCFNRNLQNQLNELWQGAGRGLCGRAVLEALSVWPTPASAASNGTCRDSLSVT